MQSPSAVFNVFNNLPSVIRLQCPKVHWLTAACYSAAMSLAEPSSPSAPFFSDDNEAEGSGEPGSALAGEEPASGVTNRRAYFTVTVLCYVNLLNYMDRFTVAGIRRFITVLLHEGQMLLP